jgi:hypothetical protein
MIANVIYFFVQPFTLANGFNTPLKTQCHLLPYSSLTKKIIDDKIEESWIQYDEYEAEFNRQTGTYAKSLVFLMVPLLALVMKILNFRKHRFYTEHLIFTLHFYSFYMFWILAVALSIHRIVYLILLHFQWIDMLKIVGSSQMLEALILLLIIFYLFFSQRQIYKEKWHIALAKSICGFFCVYIVTDVYRFILFFITYFTVKI